MRVSKDKVGIDISNWWSAAGYVDRWLTAPPEQLLPGREMTSVWGWSMTLTMTSPTERSVVPRSAFFCCAPYYAARINEAGTLLRWDTTKLGDVWSLRGMHTGISLLTTLPMLVRKNKGSSAQGMQRLYTCLFTHYLLRSCIFLRFLVSVIF